MKRKRLLLIGIIATLIAGFTVGCSDKKEEASTSKAATHTASTVKIGFVDVTGKALISDTLGIAKEKGFLDEELNKIGVKAELVPFTGAGPAINEALASKNVDIGVLGDVPAIIGKASGIDTELIIPAGSNNTAALLIPSDSNITSVKDLKGKKVATQKGSYMHRILVKMLEASGLIPNDIEFINLTAQDAAASLVAKGVDAVVVGGVVEAKLVLNKDAKILLDCSNNPEWIGASAGVVRTEYANENPEIISAVLRALDKARELTITDVNSAKEQWVKAGNSKETYDFLYPDNEYRYDAEISDKYTDKLKDVEKFLKDNSLIKNDVDIETWINKGFYKK
ncbi:MAG: aliphatic sulfonate ABC transporter substrate-binding protein [Clostridiaceae bacterium]